MYLKNIILLKILFMKYLVTIILNFLIKHITILIIIPQDIWYLNYFIIFRI